MKYTGLSRPILDLSNRYFILALTTIVIAILMYVLSSKLDEEVVNAEYSAFELRLAELHSAVLLQESVLVAKDQMDQAHRYEGFNPMNWMASDTSHYLGEMSLEAVIEQEGNWVYDPKRQVIAYKGLTNEFLAEKGETESKWLQFKVVPLWSNKEGHEKNNNLIAKGLRLQRLSDAK